MLRTTPGQLLIADALPPDLRKPGRVLDGKGIQALFQELAEKHPDKYREVARKLTSIGGEAAYSKGGLSFGVKHLRPAVGAKLIRAQLQRELDGILADRSLAPKERELRIIEAVDKRRKPLEDAVYDESLREENPLALQVLSGVRGKKMNLRSLRGGDLLYTDHRDRIIPVPVLKSYSEGLSPAEYWAGAFGARRGVVEVKTATADAGYLSKQLVQAAHRLIVTNRDDDEDDGKGHLKGLMVDSDDTDNVGALLSAPAGGYARNTVITPKVLKHLQDQGVKRLLVRSPIVGGPAQGGVYARDVGVRERGGLPPVGDYVGIAAVQALGEKTSQGMLCLWEETLVLMADGSTKAIKDVAVGDMVTGADKRGTTFPVRVSAVYDNGPRRVSRWNLLGWRTGWAEVTATDDHKVLFRKEKAGRKSDVHDVAPLSMLLSDDGYALGVHRIGFDKMAKEMVEDAAFLVSREDLGELPTRDIEVDHPDHLFVLADGLVVSNSSKHSGGVAGANAASSGFKAINSLVNPPKIFPGAAAHAQRDGLITAVAEAPQGGFNVAVDGVRHYVPTGYDLKVKQGDRVEAGDVLSAGMPNPSEIVKHKGIGEGRRYFVDAFRDVFKNSGLYGNRRNIELLARGLIDHVQLTDEVGDYAPDDVVPYSTLERDWQPRSGATTVAPNGAVGKYLERPALHYSVGTRVRPSMLPHFKEFGVDRLDVHHEPPPFQPLMIRGSAGLQHDPEWIARSLGSSLEKSTLQAAHRGSTADTQGTSFVSALLDPVSFGRAGQTQGWKGADLLSDDLLD